MTAPELVSAGAGSGKTRDIVENIAAAVEAGTPVSRIAALTFTNRAADELQRRLKRELAARGLDAAARESDSAYVSTIHAFCLRIAAEHPAESGLAPETRPLDERETEILLERAVSESLRADPAVAEEVRFIVRECLAYGRAGSPEAQLRKKLLSLAGKVRAIARGAGDLEALAGANDADLAARLPAPVEGAAFRRLLEPHLSRYAEWWEKKGRGLKLPKSMARNPGLLAPLLEDPIPHAAVQAFSPGTAGSARWADHDALAGPLRDAAFASIPHHAGWQRDYRRFARGLFRIAARALDRYAELKRGLGVIDYADMQTAALAMLAREVEGRPFADYLRARFDLVVVDEFQDTSPLQFAAIEELRGGAVRGRYVGDLKQAIYGWRDADSRLFQSLLADAGKVETLGVNYRSRKRLVEFANAVFGPAFRAAGLEYHDLAAGSPYVDRKLPASGPELQVLDAGGSKESTAARIAGWVAGLLADRSQRVWDRGTEILRPLRPGDVAVLVRSNDQAAVAGAALAEIGIRSSQVAAGLGRRPEVQLFRALVAAFSSTENRLSIAAAWAGEVYGLPPAALYEARELLRAPRAWYKGVRPPVAALERFYADLDDLRDRFRREPLPEAVDRMMERTRLRDRFAGKPDGAQALANLERCRESVREFAAAPIRRLEHLGISGRGAEAFLAWFDGDAGSEEEEVPGVRPVDEGAVQVMTIHKAKGLEFPVAVVWALGSTAAPRLDRLDVVRDPKVRGRAMLDAARVRLFPGTKRGFPTEALLGDAAAGSEAEALRGLYVAMTRARERLVLVWPGKPKPDSCLALLERSGFARGPRALRAGGKAFEFSPAISAGAAEPAPAPAGDARAEALANPDPAAFRFEEVPACGAGGLLRVSPTLLCRRFDDPAADPGDEYRPPVKRPVTIPVAIAPLAGVAGGAPKVRGRTDLGTLMHRALAAGLPLPETLERLEKIAGPEVGAYAARLLGPLREHLGSLGASGPLLVEHPFLFQAGGTAVSGVLDLAVPTPEGLWIYDLKTNEIGAAEAPLYAQYYAPQLWCYALGAAKCGLGRVAGLRLVFGTPGLVATLPACPPDFEARIAAMGA